jgi:phosphomannomutase
VIYYSTHHLPVQAALMITASHNPGNYNGIKICQGKSLLYGDAIRQIRDLYLTKQFASPGTACGTSKDYDLISDYIGELKALFPQLVGENIHAILDCGNGAAGTVLPRLIEAMQWNSTQLLYAEVDGAYPHHIADPTVEKYMEDLKGILAASNADFGLAFDGDCDRMAPMTKAGRLVKGDQLLTILSKPLLEKAPGSAIVFDISSSTFMHDAIKKWGGQPIISRTGVAAVKNKMAETGALIGGEISCHTIFKDRYYGFDDGVYSMLRLFELLYQSKQPLEAWLNELPSSVSSPTYRIPCERQQCLKIIEMLKQTFSEEPNVEIITIDGLRIHFSHGWAIVRPSSTEPLISMRFEGRQQSDLDDIIQRFYTIISQYIEWPGIMPAHSTTSRPS